MTNMNVLKKLLSKCFDVCFSIFKHIKYLWIFVGICRFHGTSNRQTFGFKEALTRYQDVRYTLFRLGPDVRDTLRGVWA